MQEANTISEQKLIPLHQNVWLDWCIDQVLFPACIVFHWPITSVSCIGSHQLRNKWRRQAWGQSLMKSPRDALFQIILSAISLISPPTAVNLSVPYPTLKKDYRGRKHDLPVASHTPLRWGGASVPYRACWDLRLPRNRFPALRFRTSSSSSSSPSPSLSFPRRVSSVRGNDAVRGIIISRSALRRLSCVVNASLLLLGLLSQVNRDGITDSWISNYTWILVYFTYPTTDLILNIEIIFLMC